MPDQPKAGETRNVLPVATLKQARDNEDAKGADDEPLPHVHVHVFVTNHAFHNGLAGGAAPSRRCGRLLHAGLGSYIRYQGDVGCNRHAPKVQLINAMQTP